MDDPPLSSGLRARAAASQEGAVTSLREEQKALTRSRIIAAAHACFASMGAGAVSFDDIAREAGVGRATVYLHFPSREALWLAMLREDWRVQRVLFATFPTEDISLATVAGWLRRLVSGFRARRISMSAYAQLLGSDPALNDSVNVQREQLLVILGERFDAFAVADRSDAARWIAAYLVLVQIEQFCQFAAGEAREDLVAAGIDLLSAQIVAFVRDATP